MRISDWSSDVCSSDLERVCGGAGGGGHDEPVGGVGGEVLAVDAHGQAHGVTRRRLLDHGFVEGDVLGGLHALDAGGEQHALLDLVRAGQVPLDRHAGAVRVDLGEVAELANVDPDDGDAGRSETHTSDLQSQM